MRVCVRVCMQDIGRGPCSLDLHAHTYTETLPISASMAVAGGDEDDEFEEGERQQEKMAVDDDDSAAGESRDGEAAVEEESEGTYTSLSMYGCLRMHRRRVLCSRPTPPPFLSLTHRLCTRTHTVEEEECMEGATSASEGEEASVTSSVGAGEGESGVEEDDDELAKLPVGGCAFGLVGRLVHVWGLYAC